MTDDPPVTHATAVLTAVPDQRRRRRPRTALGDRTVRQVRGIDAWCAAVTTRQQLLAVPSGSREGQLDQARRSDVLQRSHASMVATTALGLARDPRPMQYAGATVVVAHNHPWFLAKVCSALAEHGFEILGRTDNGADALGTIVAEQPDLVVVGDRLAMMTGVHLLAETSLFSPSSVRIAHADDDRAGALRTAGADAVLARHVPPADLVDRAGRLLVERGAGPGAGW